MNDIEIPKASYYQLKHTDGTSSYWRASSCALGDVNVWLCSLSDSGMVGPLSFLTAACWQIDAGIRAGPGRRIGIAKSFRGISEGTTESASDVDTDCEG